MKNVEACPGQENVAFASYIETKKKPIFDADGIPKFPQEGMPVLANGLSKSFSLLEVSPFVFCYHFGNSRILATIFHFSGKRLDSPSFDFPSFLVFLEFS